VFDHPKSFGIILAPEPNEWECESGWIAPGVRAAAPGVRAAAPGRPAQNAAQSTGAEADPTILCW